MFNCKDKSEKSQAFLVSRRMRSITSGALLLGATMLLGGRQVVRAENYPASEFPGDDDHNGSGGWGIYLHRPSPNSPATIQGRTQWNEKIAQNPDGKQNPESMNNGEFRRFKLYKYNPYDPGGPYFLGAEILTNKDFGHFNTTPKDTNVTANRARTFKAKIKLPPEGLASGAVAGFYEQANPADEIDFEFLGKLLPNSLWLNLHNNGQQLASTSLGAQWPVSNTWSDWHTYEINWFKDTVVWSIDGVGVRRVNSTTYVPDAMLKVHLNIWAPSSTGSDAFPQAADGNLQTASKFTTASATYFDVAGVTTGAGTKSVGRTTKRKRQ